MDANVLSTQITIGLLGAGFLRYLKSSPWFKAINEYSSSINHAVLLITSAIGALGIHYVWDARAHSLTITGLEWATIFPALWLWGKQWAVQFLVHKGAFGDISINAPDAKPLDLNPTKP